MAISSGRFELRRKQHSVDLVFEVGESSLRHYVHLHAKLHAEAIPGVAYAEPLPGSDQICSQLSSSIACCSYPAYLAYLASSMRLCLGWCTQYGSFRW